MKRIILTITLMFLLAGCSGMSLKDIQMGARDYVGSAGEGQYIIVTDCEKDMEKVGGMECRLRSVSKDGMPIYEKP